jgi:hypothetical protein
MVFDKVQGRRKASILAAMAAGAFVIGAPLPAAAEEDTNMFNSVLGFVGLQFDKEQDSIDYRARAPIVVPPRLDLPQPKESARSASWPVDPDVAERRKAALSANQPAPQLTPNARVEMSPRELSRVTGDLPKEGPPSECQSGAGTPICLYAPWKALQAVVGGGQADVVQPGVEPNRKYLTEPPPGYRKATAATALAPDKVKEEADPSDPAAYNRSQRRKTSVE